MSFRAWFHFFLSASLFSILLQARAEELQKVVWQKVRNDGLVATLLQPKGSAQCPAIIVVGGSEGGVQSAESLAYRFAERGWAALAVAYFGTEGLPDTLANIPLEYFDRAATWLMKQPRVNSGGLALIGVSRGAELALLFAAHNPAISRVVAYCPSHVVWGPVGNISDTSVSAWTCGDAPLPYLPHARQPDYSAKPYCGTPDFVFDLRQTEAAKAAAIPVEKIQGRILLLSGDDDQVWPSRLMSRLIVRRLQAAHFPHSFEHISFPGAGHLISPGSDPGLIEATHPSGVVMAFGGTKSANREAQDKAWAKVVEFLGEP